MDKLIWSTVIFLAFLAFYSLYSPLFRKRLIDELVAGLGTVGIIGLGLIWSYVAFGNTGNTECSEGWKIFLILAGAILMILGLIAAMMLIMAIWGVIISLVFPKHAQKLFCDDSKKVS